MDELNLEPAAKKSEAAPVVVPVLAEIPVPSLPLERPVIASPERPRPEIYSISAGLVSLVPGEVIPEKTTGRRRKQAPGLVWTAPRRKYVAEYIAVLQGALHLRDWEVRLDFDTPSDDEDLATMTPYQDQRRAVMRFGLEFLDQRHDEMRQTLVHEMLHCHLFQLHHMTENIIASLGGDMALRAGLPAVTSSVELATDALADAFAPLLPVFELPSR